MSNEIIAPSCARRLIKDIRSLVKDPLESENIYYLHDDDNMLKGYAMIIGPPGSLYQNGAYFFELEYPPDYPFAPPVVTMYNLLEDNIRYHPNMYRTGKVCISILNTWRGEKWTSCQSIRSVLLTMCMLLDDKPLLHEPGITEKHHDFEKYNKIIEFKNLDVHCLQLAYDKIKLKPCFVPFLSRFKQYVEKHKMEIKDRLTKLADMNKCSNITTIVYNMKNVEVNYDKLITFLSN